MPRPFHSGPLLWPCSLSLFLIRVTRDDGRMACAWFLLSKGQNLHNALSLVHRFCSCSSHLTWYELNFNINHSEQVSNLARVSCISLNSAQPLTLVNTSLIISQSRCSPFGPRLRAAFSDKLISDDCDTKESSLSRESAHFYNKSCGHQWHQGRDSIHSKKFSRKSSPTLETCLNY